MFSGINAIRSVRKMGRGWPFFVLFLLLFLSACTTNDLFAIDKHLSDAIENGDPSMCTDIRDKDLFRQDRRRDECYLLVAQKIRDTKVCLEVKDAMQFDKCFLQLALTLQDENICTQVKNETSRYRCYQEVAIVSKQPDLCVQSGPEPRQYACYMALAKELEDPKICDNISHSPIKAQCLIDVAVQVQDDAICRLIENKERYSNQDSCLILVASAMKDQDICQQVGDRADKDECYQGVAVLADSVDVCNNIDNENIKKLCQDVINNKK